jgi:dTDP-4-dehydrorhamnose 3,5-epimerase
MLVTDAAIPDVKILSPKRFGDARGYFSETWSADRMREAGLEFTFVQDNESLSAEVNTLRGLHYQAPPFAQTKLVRVALGAILDVAVDVRIGSPTYRRWVSAVISAENGAQLLVPRGFLHGFVTLTPDTLVMYKVDNPYSAECDGTVFWADPELGVQWGVDPANAVLSDKDRTAVAFADWNSPFDYGVVQ